MSHERTSCTLIGSLRKYSADFNRIHDQLENQNIEVKAPIKGTPVKEINGYALFDTEDTTSPLVIESGYLAALLSSDFGYIINPNGYIGAHSTAEIALARLFHIPLYSLETLDLNLDQSTHWQELAQHIQPVKPEFLVPEGLTRFQTRRRSLSDANLEHLSLYVLGADWLKDYQGLGKILDHTLTNASRLANRHDCLVNNISGICFNDSKPQSSSPSIGTQRNSATSSAGFITNFS